MGKFIDLSVAFPPHAKWNPILISSEHPLQGEAMLPGKREWGQQRRADIQYISLAALESYGVLVTLELRVDKLHVIGLWAERITESFKIKLRANKMIQDSKYYPLSPHHHLHVRNLHSFPFPFLCASCSPAQAEVSRARIPTGPPVGQSRFYRTWNFEHFLIEEKNFKSIYPKLGMTVTMF